MLLAIDIGNSNITLGIFDGAALKTQWRLETERAHDRRELGELLKHFFSAEKIDPKKIGRLAISNVVPVLQQNFSELSRNFFNQTPLWVTPETAKIPLRVDTPEEVGADRLCNAVAAWEKWHCATIVVDFGTATTLDIVTAKGEYGGGAIVLGLEKASLALAQSTAQLPQVPIIAPKKVVGRSTVECIQAGLYHGYAGMVDHLVALSEKEEKVKMKVVATGGLAPLMAKAIKRIESVEPHLTLEGIYFIAKRNS